jgi:TorA maturation chaperone TorD
MTEIQSEATYSIVMNSSLGCMDIEPCVEREVIFRLLAILVNNPPNPELIDQLRSFGFKGIQSSVKLNSYQNKILTGIQEISRFLQDTSDISKTELTTILACDWTRLFLGVGPYFGPQPPYESLYLGITNGQPNVLAELNGIYKEAGLAISPLYSNRYDFLGFELDFVRYLAEKETQAIEKDLEETARRFRDLSHSFVENHLSIWVGAYCEIAIKKARTGFYRGFLTLLDPVIQSCHKGDNF